MTARMLIRGLVVMAMAFGRSGDCLAPTDTITWGGDNSRSGYFPNNNMDPAVVRSSDFGQVFKVQLPGNYLGTTEKIFSQPLIYTPASGDGTQYVYWATAQNNVYKMNAKTGEILASRNLHIPFMSADLADDGQTTPGYCPDISPVVGIIGTGVIDPDTDTLYLSSKTYANESSALIGVPQGRPAGRIYIHALNIHDLSERPNFPINLEGLAPRNNPARTFNGGIQNQRPGLLHPVGSDYIYAGFGSHCVHYNFTGRVIAWHKTTGQIVEHFATQGQGVDSPKKGASLWMSGGGISSDDKGSIYFATGNGYSGQVGDVPINRGTPPTSLEEAAVHMSYNNTDGSIAMVDFFIPANIGYLNGGDLDLGTSPLALLPPDVFTCGNVKRMGVVTGKDHTSWFLNLDDLGGFQTGPNRVDRVIGSYVNENSVYAGVGVYPLEGGYVYVNVIGYQSRVFKFNCVGGVPAFTRVAESTAGGKNGFGVSHGTVTSLNGQAGTGLFWVTDVDNNVPEQVSFRIYEAVPTGEVIKFVKGFNVPAINKFTRPHFGDGIVYFGTSQGLVYAFGAPTNPALNCTAGVDFGTVNVGVQAIEKTIVCTAKIGVTVTGAALDSTDFSASGLPTFPLQLAAQGTFSFKANFKPGKVGALSSTVVFSTTNNVAGYAKTTSVRLVGTAESANALLAVTPGNVTFAQAVVNSNPVSDSVIFANQGKTLLNIQGIQFSQNGSAGPFVPANIAGGSAQIGQFTLSNLPSTIAALSQQLVTVTYDPSVIGNQSLYASITSDGGSAVLLIKGSAGQSPVALIQLEKPDGSGWQTWTPSSADPLSFGGVVQNTNRPLRFRITNTAPAGSVALSIPISKPPFGTPGLINTLTLADIGEGTTVPAGGGYVEAIIACTVPKAQWNTDNYTDSTAWTLNTNDVNLGKVNVPFTCNAYAQQGGPVKDNGQGLYRYVGCFRENYPSGRQLQSQLYGNDNNTAGNCLSACAAKGYTFCGAQYHRECWGGPKPPQVQVPDVNCGFSCTGDINQYCGGDGTGNLTGNPFISLWATNTTLPPPPGGPYVNPGVNGYTSIGCYTEATTGRALSNGVTPTGGLKTVAACVSACSALNYKYIGLEYGGECWCANQFTAGAVPTAITDCSTTCKDNATEYCGAGSRLNVYQKDGTLSSTSSSSTTLTGTATLTGSTSATPSLVSSTTTSAAPTSTVPVIVQTVGLYRYQGCYDETTQGGRSLAGKTYTDDLMTLEKCAAACTGFTWWGTEYERECYCGSELRGNTALDPDQTTCKLLCKGNQLTFCGGSSRLSLYKYDPSLNVTTSSSSSTSSTTIAVTSTISTTTTPSSSTLAPTSSTASTSSIILTSTPDSTSTASSSTTATSTGAPDSTSTATSASTPGSTSTTATSTVAAENAPTTTTSTSSLDSTSTTTTSTSTLSVSSITTSTTATTATSSISSSTAAAATSSTSSTTQTTLTSFTTSSTPSSTPIWPGNVNFTYYGCVSEPSNGRLLTKQVASLADMTQDKCLQACWMYAYAGVEYAKECWCGNGPLNWAGNAGATPGGNATESECSKPCPGNTTQKCGASKRLNLFYLDPAKKAGGA